MTWEDAQKIVLPQNPPIGYTGTFYRKGQCPKSGMSRNFQTGELEKGVSVYLSRSATSFAGLCSKSKWYEVVGTVVGTGSDGEPLVKVISEKLVDSQSGPGHRKGR